MTTKKSVLISLPVIALIILGAVFYSASSNAHSWKYNPWQKALSVTFAPEAATITLAPGETKTIEVTATINCKDTRRKLTTAVSPELAPYISVSPTTISKCKRNQSNHNYQTNRHWWQFWSWWKKDSDRNWRQKKTSTTTVTLNITADIPETIESQTLPGTVWLEGRKVRSVRLPVELSIWPFTNEDKFIAYYPPEYKITKPTLGKIHLNTISINADDSDPRASIEIMSLPMDQTQAIALVTSMYSTNAYSENAVTVDGKRAVEISGVLDEKVFGWGGFHHTFIIIPTDSGSVLQIEYDSSDTAVSLDVILLLDALDVF